MPTPQSVADWKISALRVARITTGKRAQAHASTIHFISDIIRKLAIYILRNTWYSFT